MRRLNVTIFILRLEMTQAEFNEVIVKNQEIQKRNPFGSKEHRAAYDAIREAVKEFHGNDIGEYEE